jgi:hypothetical protein
MSVSPKSCQDAQMAVGGNAPFGMTVSFGPVPANLGSGTEAPPGTVAVDGRRALVHQPPDWSLLVVDGTHVTIEWHGADEPPGWLVDSWAVQIATMQRGLLNLHASVVDVGGHAIAVGGQSGAGKSTTAMALHRRGHRLIVDDSTVIEFRNGEPWVLPFHRSVHLTADAVSLVTAAAPTDTELTDLPLDRLSKKSVWTPPFDHDLPVRLAGIVILERRQDLTQLTVTEVRGAARVPLVAQQAGRPQSSGRILGVARTMTEIAALCDKVSVLHICRPAATSSLDGVLDAIESFGRSA